VWQSYIQKGKTGKKGKDIQAEKLLEMLEIDTSKQAQFDHSKKKYILIFDLRKVLTNAWMATVVIQDLLFLTETVGGF